MGVLHDWLIETCRSKGLASGRRGYAQVVALARGSDGMGRHLACLAWSELEKVMWMLLALGDRVSRRGDHAYRGRLAEIADEAVQTTLELYRPDLLVVKALPIWTPRTTALHDLERALMGRGQWFESDTRGISPFDAIEHAALMGLDNLTQMQGDADFPRVLRDRSRDAVEWMLRMETWALLFAEGRDTRERVLLGKDKQARMAQAMKQSSRRLANIVRKHIPDPGRVT